MEQRPDQQQPCHRGREWFRIVGWGACWVEQRSRGRQQHKRSTAGGAVTGTGNLVGGLVGWNNGPISSSHATGDVDGATYVGGLVGSNYGADGVNKISDSTAVGGVTGSGDLVGGLDRMEHRPDQQQPCHRDREWIASLSGGLLGQNYDDRRLEWPCSRTECNRREHGRRRRNRHRLLGRRMVGFNNGPISDSRATGTRVSGYGTVGGLVGANTNGPGGGVNTIMRSHSQRRRDRHQQLGRRSGRN